MTFAPIACCPEHATEVAKMVANAHPTAHRTPIARSQQLCFMRYSGSKDFGNDESSTHEGDLTTPHLRVGTRCVRGSYREANEDKCYADLAHGLFVVTDGMGGHEGGAEASRIVIDVVPTALRAVLAAEVFDEQDLQTAIIEALEQAREKMLRRAEENPRLYKMGATVAIAIIRDHVAYVARVGDCRVYRVRGDTVTRLTTDQTFAQELQNAGAISEEDVRTSSFRHVVTNSLGVKPLQYEPTIDRIDLQSADRLVMVTDGATDSLSDDAIRRAARHGCPNEAADTLALEALRSGSHDNVTCIVIKVVPESVYWHEENACPSQLPQ